MTNPSNFSSSDLIPRLTAEFGYSSITAKRIAEKLASMDSEVRKYFWIWWNTGDKSEIFSVNGFTATRLQSEFDLNPIAAFSTLDWMLREPEKALATLKRNDAVL